MTLKETIWMELESLPEEKIAEVLNFIRFLKINLGSEAEIERRFSQAVAQARSVAAERGITEQDISEEVTAVRAEQ